MSQDLQTTVISACAKHDENSQNDDYRRRVYLGMDYFVKYGSRSDLESELATHKYIFAHAQQTNTPDTPRIPQIVHHFVDQNAMYLVMERIKLQESPPDLAARKQKAIKWLTELPLPSNYALGPVGRGLIRHRFFNDSEAPFVFPDVVTLDQYINRVRPCFDFLECPPPPTCTLGQAYYRLLSVWARKTYSPVSICGERVMFTQSDMDDSNFGVDEHGRTVLMDFSKIGMLPETLVAYMLSKDDAACLGLSGNSNLASTRASMAMIAQYLAMVANPELGISTCV